MTIGDKLFIAWFVVGIAITYLIDMEQVRGLSPKPHPKPQPGPKPQPHPKFQPGPQKPNRPSLSWSR